MSTGPSRVRQEVHESRVSLHDSSAQSIVRGATGREIHFETKQDDRDAQLITEWSQCGGEEALLSHNGATKFRQYMNNVKILEASPFVAYRGRYEEEDMRPQPMPDHFGPPPIPEKAQA